MVRFSRRGAVVCIMLLAGCATRTPPSSVPPPAEGVQTQTSRSSALTELLPSPAASGSLAPELATDGSLLYMTWLEPVEGGGHAVRWASWDGGAWSQPSILVEGTDLFVNPFDRPGLHPLGGGRLLAHWLQKSAPDTYAYDVVLAHSLDGGETWSDPYRLHEDRKLVEHGFPSVAVLPDGTAHIYWLDGRDAPSEENYTTTLWMRAWDAGELGPEQRVDPLTCDCCATAAIAMNGGSLVAYRDRTVGEVRDISVAESKGGSPHAPISLAADGWAISGCPVNGPALARSSQHAVAVWPTFAQDTPRVQISWSRGSGGGFGPAHRVDSGLPLGRVDAVMIGEDEAMLSWIEGGDQGPAIVTRAVGAAGWMGEPVFRTGAEPSLAGTVPRIEMVNGQVFLTWASSSTSSIVFARLQSD